MMIETGKVYETRNGYNAHIIWTCRKPVEGHNMFYAILDDGILESKPVCYFDNGKFYTWSAIECLDDDFDIILK